MLRRAPATTQVSNTKSSAILWTQLSFLELFTNFPDINSQKLKYNYMEVALREFLCVVLGVRVYALNYLLAYTALHKTFQDKAAA